MLSILCNCGRGYSEEEEPSICVNVEKYIMKREMTRRRKGREYDIPVEGK